MKMIWLAAVLAAVLTAGCAAPASDEPGTAETDRTVQTDGADVAPADEDGAGEKEENTMTNEAKTGSMVSMERIPIFRWGIAMTM